MGYSSELPSVTSLLLNNRRLRTPIAQMEKYNIRRRGIDLRNLKPPSQHILSLRPMSLPAESSLNKDRCRLLLRRPPDGTPISLGGVRGSRDVFHYARELPDARIRRTEVVSGIYRYKPVTNGESILSDRDNTPQRMTDRGRQYRFGDRYTGVHLGQNHRRRNDLHREPVSRPRVINIPVYEKSIPTLPQREQQYDYNDDHQLELTNALHDRSEMFVVRDTDGLKPAIDRVRSRSGRSVTGENSLGRVLARYLDDIES